MHSGEWSRRGLVTVVGFLVVLLLAPLVPLTAEAQSLGEQRRDAERKLEGVEGDLSDAEDELAEIERRHAAASERLAEIEARIAQIQERIAELEQELSVAKEELAAAEQALADTEAELAQTEDELDETRVALSGQQELFSERVRSAFKRSNVGVALSVLDSGDIQEATQAAHFVRTFMAKDVEHIEAITALESRVETTVARLGELRERRDAERQAAEDERDRVAGLMDEQKGLKAEADAQADEQRSLMATLEREEQRYNQLVASLESESDKLEQQLAQIAAEERRIEEERRREEQRRREAAERRRQQEQAERRQAAAASRDSGGSSGGGSSSSASSSQSSSQLQRPVASRFRVTSGFGYRTHPIHGTRRLHAGMDFGRSPSGEAINGKPIRAAESGTVVSAGSRGGYGITVVINHGGGMSTLYAHQSRVAVNAGQRVSRGQVIGYVGNTGTSTAPHLHFEVRINGSPVNPAPYIR